MGRAGRLETNGVAISFVRNDSDVKKERVIKENNVLDSIMLAYPDKLLPLPQDYS